MEAIKFVPPRENYKGLLRRIARLHKFDLPDTPTPATAITALNSAAAQLPPALGLELHRIFIETQRANAEWVEGRFKTMRQEYKEPFLDGMIIDEEGRLKADIRRPWSSISVYPEGKDPPPTMDEMMELINREQRLLFPMTPQRDSCLFWLISNEEAILQALNKELKQDPIEVEDYPINERAILPVGESVRMTRAERDRVGKGRLTPHGIVIGKLGFWQNSRLNRSSGTKYFSRVYIQKTSQARRITISPFQEGEVIKTGGIPMNEKYNTRVIRPEPPLVKLDFVAAALVAFSQADRVPLVIRFNPIRPWLGESPQHK